MTWKVGSVFSPKALLSDHAYDEMQWLRYKFWKSASGLLKYTSAVFYKTH